MLTYSNLVLLPTFEERLEYLKTDQMPSELTFGHLRYLNQKFYNSREWKRAKVLVIARDLGFDLGIPGREIFGRVMVHHMNPLKPKDLYYNSERSLDPEFLITVSKGTHDAIHFNRKEPELIEDRRLGDTTLW